MQKQNVHILSVPLKGTFKKWEKLMFTDRVGHAKTAIGINT